MSRGWKGTLGRGASRARKERGTSGADCAVVRGSWRSGDQSTQAPAQIAKELEALLAASMKLLGGKRRTGRFRWRRRCRGRRSQRDTADGEIFLEAVGLEEIR